MDDSVDALLDAVYLLVERFVQRQQLPLEVIREFRPYWVDSTKHRPSKKYASATGTGYWGENNEWRYYLHGVGCRLIHTITGEPVDWDASDPYRFDPYWFVEWLSWFLKQNVFFRQPTEEKAILTISSMIDEQNKDGFRKKILAVLEQLHQQGRLLCPPDYTNKYKLIV